MHRNLGWLIDQGVSMETMAVGFLIYLALAIIGVMFALAKPVPVQFRDQ